MGFCPCGLRKVVISLFLVFSCLFIVSLILAFVVFPIIVDIEVKKATKLEEGTDQYDRFIDIPFPLDFKVNIFNVENPEEILNGSAKPRVKETGPYVYKQYRHKTVVETDDEEDTISYTQIETFEFDAEASGNYSENDLVTVLNAPLMAIYQIAEDLLLAGAVDTCIRSTFPEGLDKIFITIPVRQLLFEGFNFCRNTATGMCALVNDIACAIASTKRNTDTLPDYSLQFSFLNYKVKAHDGKYTVKRGLDDIQSLGHIMAWNDMKYTDYWRQDSSCNRVKGSDSTIYPPGVTEDSNIFIFSTDVCRSVGINFVGEATYKDVDGYVFATNPKTLYSATENPEDDCYCTKDIKDINGTKSCFLDGLIDMETCFGVPVLFSFPHFLWADEKYLNGVEGLSPDPDVHKTYLLVEPNTGTPLIGVKRIQLNAVVRPINGIKSMTESVRSVLPLFWIEEGVSLPDKYVDLIQTTYFDKIKILDGFKYALIAVFALLSIVSGGFTIKMIFF